MLTVLLSGCASVPVVMPFKDHKLIIANQSTLDEKCSSVISYWDNGTVVRQGQHFMGCWLPGSREIWVRSDCGGAKALPHEYCHKDGKRDCSNYDWPE